MVALRSTPSRLSETSHLHEQKLRSSNQKRVILQQATTSNNPTSKPLINLQHIKNTIVKANNFAVLEPTL